MYVRARLQIGSSRVTQVHVRYRDAVAKVPVLKASKLRPIPFIERASTGLAG